MHGLLSTVYLKIAFLIALPLRDGRQFVIPLQFPHVCRRRLTPDAAPTFGPGGHSRAEFVVQIESPGFAGLG